MFVHSPWHPHHVSVTASGCNLGKPLLSRIVVPTRDIADADDMGQEIVGS